MEGCDFNLKSYDLNKLLLLHYYKYHINRDKNSTQQFLKDIQIARKKCDNCLKSSIADLFVIFKWPTKNPPVLRHLRLVRDSFYYEIAI